MAASFGPCRDGGGGGSLAVAVDQPHVAPGQGAGYGDLNGKGRLAYAALGVSYGNNHIGTSKGY
ncbi:hypothetical protein XAPC_4165 [Xanthomonas citri pv. punicae str. LMG 859]|nr:hypothetical protein XAPC_4165 [Xanthomonas citri pv. punicae str. LMG 859]